MVIDILRDYRKECIKEKYSKSENSSCPTLRGHLSNSWALVHLPLKFLEKNGCEWSLKSSEAFFSHVRYTPLPLWVTSQMDES